MSHDHNHPEDSELQVEHHEPILILSTISPKSEAQTLAHLLVQEQAAACVNISGELSSVYRWQGNIETESEWLLIIKTTRELEEAVYNIILEQHPYEVPEILSITVEAGEEKYLTWIKDQVSL